MLRVGSKAAASVPPCQCSLRKSAASRNSRSRASSLRLFRWLNQMIIWRKQIESFPSQTKMFQKFMGSRFLMALTPGHDGNGAFWARVFQSAVGNMRRPFADCHLRNQGNPHARRNQGLNGRKLAGADDDAGTKIGLVTERHSLISEAMVFLQKDEFFRVQIVRENHPLLGKGMPGRKCQQQFFGK